MQGRNGPLITMRPGETADLRVSALCREVISLSTDGGGVLQLHRLGRAVEARRTGQAKIMATIPMCAQVADTHCIGGVDILGAARIKVVAER